LNRSKGSPKTVAESWTIIFSYKTMTATEKRQLKVHYKNRTMKSRSVDEKPD
jgi:hypothetical protein